MIAWMRHWWEAHRPVGGIVRIESSHNLHRDPLIRLRKR